MFQLKKGLPVDTLALDSALDWPGMSQGSAQGRLATLQRHLQSLEFGTETGDAS